MAFYKEDIVDINLNTGNIFRSFLGHSIGYKDDDADRFGIRAFRDGVPVDLSGASCQAIFMNPNGTNIALTSYGTVSGNVAYVTLPPACYDYEGQFCLAIKLVGDGVTGTVRIVDGTVTRTGASGAVAPTSSVPTYQEILSTYDAMVAATSAANLAIAETFDATKAYPACKYVINEGHLYRLTADHAANVTWANTSKVATNFGDDLSSLKSALSGVRGIIGGFSGLLFVNGTIYQGKLATESYNSHRVALAEYVSYPYDVQFWHDSVYVVFLFEIDSSGSYTDEFGNTVKQIEMYTTTPVTIPANTRFRFDIRNPNVVQPAVADIVTFVSCLHITNRIDIISEDVQDLENGLAETNTNTARSFRLTRNIIGGIEGVDFVNGTIYQGKISTASEDRNRVAFAEYISYPFDITIQHSSGYALFIYKKSTSGEYTDENGDTVTLVESYSTTPVQIPANTQFRFDIRNPDVQSGQIADIDVFISNIYVTDITKYGKNLDNVKQSIGGKWLLIEYVNGTIYQGKLATESYNNHRVATSKYSSYLFDTYIYAKGDFVISIAVKDENGEYTDEFGNKVTQTTLYSNAKMLIPAGAEFRFDIRDPNTTQGTQADIHEFVSNIVLMSEYEYLCYFISREHARNAYFMSISHQGYSATGYGSDKLSAFFDSYRNGFDCIEVDLQWSSDGVIMCCHDSSFVDATTGDTIVISDYTADQLKEFDYYGETIGTLADVLQIAKKYSLRVQLDKVTSDWTDTQWNTLFAVVSEYGLKKAIIYPVTNEAMKNKVYAFYPDSDILIGCHSDGLSSAISSGIEYHSGNGNVYIACEQTDLTREMIVNATATAPEYIKVGVWTVDNLANYKNYFDVSAFITSNNYSYANITD